MSESARVGDPIAHTRALIGLFGGFLAGALLGATVISTGGLTAVAVIGAVASGGALVGEVIGGLSWFSCIRGR